MRDKIEQYYDLPGIAEFGIALGKLVFFLFLVFGVGFWLVNKLTKLDDHEELFVKHNYAFAAERAGFMLALGLGTWPLIVSKSGDWAYDLAWMFGGALWSTLLLLVARPALSKLMGYERAEDGIKDRTVVPVGIARASFFIAGGWILNASFSGSAPDLPTAIAATVAFSALGLLTLALTFWLLGRFAGMKKRICQGNLAAAITASGFIIALGLGLRAAIAGDFTDWTSGLVGFIITYVIELVFFSVCTILIDLWLIRHTTLREVVEEKNVITAFFFAVALVIAGIGASMVTI